MSIESVMASNHLILSCPLLLLPSIFPRISVFSSKSALPIRWPNYWSFSIVLPMNIWGWFPLGLTGLIFWQSKGLSRVFSSTTILQCSAFFMIQLSHLYMPTGKTIALLQARVGCVVLSKTRDVHPSTSLVPAKVQVSFNFMSSVTICSDFRV